MIVVTIRSQGYEPVRASMMVNDEEVDVDLRPAAEAVPVVEEEQPEQLSLLSLEKSTEDLLVERVMQRGPLIAACVKRLGESRMMNWGLPLWTALLVQ